MPACLESANRPVAPARGRLAQAATRWLRLAFACLAVVAGGLPAQAEAQRPELPVATCVRRTEAARQRGPARANAARPWLGVAPRSLGRQALRPAARAAQRAQSPPPPGAALFLAHRALLR